MTDADLRLRAAFAADEPPTRDPAFALTIMDRIARRRLAMDLAGAAVAAVAAAVILWALWPVLARGLDPLMANAWRSFGPVVAVLAVIASLIAFDRAPGMLRRST
jgi:hypothetical protein